MGTVELEDLVKHGLVAEVCRAEVAYHLSKVIGEHADQIKASPSNFDELFGTIQRHAQREALLSVARLFDRPSSRFPTRCFRGVIGLLEREAANLPAIKEIPNAEALLRRLRIIGETESLASLLERPGGRGDSADHCRL